MGSANDAPFEIESMTYSRTIFIAASHAIEDLPADLGSELASDYLTAWTSLWDPRLLVAAGSANDLLSSTVMDGGVDYGILSMDTFVFGASGMRE